MNIKNRWINYQEKIFLDLTFINFVKKESSTLSPPSKKIYKEMQLQTSWASENWGG